MHRTKRKRGGQPGNQNARKHGFYAKVLEEAEQVELELAEGITGIDDEIAVLRLKIQSLLEHDADNLQLLIQATSTLARLLRTKYQLDAGQGHGLKEAMLNVITDLGIPIGIAIAKG